MFISSLQYRIQRAGFQISRNLPIPQLGRKLLEPR